MTMRTIAFGEIEQELALPFSDGGIAWEESLVFPGLAKGDELRSSVQLAPRAPIFARDGSVLAEGPAEARSHPLGSEAIDVTGEVGAADPDDRERLAAEGYPPGTPVGISGVEQAFNSRLAGKPGGELLADSGGGQPRVLGSSKPRRGEAVKTTIDPTLQSAAVSGLAGRSGGVAVLDARSGAVRALAGQAFSAPQPPGSTFKVITTTAALQADAVSLDDTFPYTSGVNVGGRFISNAHGEVCGGDFRTAFAESCNAVFAPLGPKVGNDALVGTAERYGFNQKPTLYDASATAAVDPPEPSIPADVGDDLDLGVSAIGQGEVLSTPLEMASVAQTVANHGVRVPTPLVVKKELRDGRGADPGDVEEDLRPAQRADGRRGHRRHRDRRRDPRGAGRGQDRDRGAGPRARPGGPAQPAADSGRLVHRLRPLEEGEAGGGRDADRRRRRRRHGRRPGRRPGALGRALRRWAFEPGREARRSSRKRES